jgi:hypothetical protein
MYVTILEEIMLTAKRMGLFDAFKILVIDAAPNVKYECDVNVIAKSLFVL